MFKKEKKLRQSFHLQYCGIFLNASILSILYNSTVKPSYPGVFFVEPDKLILKFIWSCEKLRIAKIIFFCFSFWCATGDQTQGFIMLGKYSVTELHPKPAKIILTKGQT
jgi:hypothetical protein